MTNSETFFRLLRDTPLYCQHCGYAYDPVYHLCLYSSGKVVCKRCKNRLPQLDHRTYGMNSHMTDWYRFDSDDHWTKSFRNRPLWAI